MFAVFDCAEFEWRVVDEDVFSRRDVIRPAERAAIRQIADEVLKMSMQRFRSSPNSRKELCSRWD